MLIYFEKFEMCLYVKANTYYLFVEFCGKMKNDDPVIALPLGQKVRD